MARLTSIITFKGSLEGLTAYKMEGVEGAVLRKKGGPTKEQIRSASNFSLTRKNNKEQGGRSRAAGFVLDTFGGLRPVVDQSCAGRINAILKVAQESDSESLYGQRHVLLSKAPWLLEGLALRRANPLESVLAGPMSCKIDKAALSAAVALPALLTGINFFNPGNLAFYRLVATLGMVPDLFYNQQYDHYFPHPDYNSTGPQTMMTDWFPVKSGSPATELRLELPNNPGVGFFSLVLTVGVQWGAPGMDGSVDLNKKVKSARIERVV